jgi:hypothetical protein
MTMAHTDPRPKDRIVTDEHPGYDPRTHWCGEDRRPNYNNDPAFHFDALMEREWHGLARTNPTNLRRVRVWAEVVQAASRIAVLLAMFAAGVLVGAYAESAVWR